MAANTSITRFTGGVSTARPGGLHENLREPFQGLYHRLFDDFDKYTAADWLVQATGAATAALVAGDGGVAQITNTAANNDVAAVWYAGGTGAASPTFLFEANKDMVFGCSVAVDSALNTGLILGLAVFQAGPFPTPQSGIMVTKSIGSLYPQGIMQNSGAGAAAFQSQTPMLDNTFFDLGIIYTAVDGACVMYMGQPNQPTSAFRLTGNTVGAPIAALTPILGIQNGTALAHTLKIDWFHAAKSRRAG